MYYIYHIPNHVHRDGSVGKIGCTELRPRERVAQQKSDVWELLEEHEDIYIASKREIELQQQYGYKVDHIPYWKTKQNLVNSIDRDAHRDAFSRGGRIGNREGKSRGGKKGGATPNKSNIKQAIEIRSLYSTGEYTIRQIAYDLNLEYGTVYNIVKNKSYKEKKKEA